MDGLMIYPILRETSKIPGKSIRTPKAGHLCTRPAIRGRDPGWQMWDISMDWFQGKSAGNHSFSH